MISRNHESAGTDPQVIPESSGLTPVLLSDASFLPEQHPDLSTLSAKASENLGASHREQNFAEMLIPVRMLNEFTYCPRLGYLEFVQGEWAENIETMEGKFGHRHVDKPDRKEIPEPVTSRKSKKPQTDEAEVEEEIIHARSMMLSAEKEGLIAKLDLLEIEGNLVTPVDYKRGKVPDISEGAYDPERVQVCAQGLILRENGYVCNEGVIYYIASRKRVTIPFTDELVAFTRQQLQAFREVATAGVCPPPLDDSPKCPRCSLVGICLPDETNFIRNAQLLEGHADSDHFDGDETVDLNTTASPQRDGLRRLLPAQSRALPLYVQNQGAFIGKTGERLTVKLKGEELTSVRFLDVSQVCAYGNVMFSAQAISEMTSRGIPICHLSYGGWFHSMTTGMIHKNVELRIRQFAIAADQQESLQISRQLISGKIRNCRTLLRRHLKDRNHPVLKKLAEYDRRARIAASAETLLGLEGMAAKEYFTEFFRLFPQQQEFDVNNRNRRPPRDPVNAVLSFVYSLLTKEMTVTLQAVGFDPMLGVFHRPRYGRPSLALDLAEEFRPLIADSVGLMVFNNGEVTPSSFLHRAGAVTMTDAGRRSVIAAYERRLETEITHPLFGYKICYRRIFEVQARLLARHMLGELPDYPNFVTR